MAEDLLIAKGTKEEQYQNLLPQLKGLLEGETDLVANMANISAALKEQFGWLWVGFYLVKPSFANLSSRNLKIDAASDGKNEELVLGPFQGPVACNRIKKGRGVCGVCWEKAVTLIVPDVEKFPGHIACSSLSKSEIVIPVLKNNIVVAVLDADSDELSHFDETDKKYLEQIVNFLY